jgi:hypothetical protein
VTQDGRAADERCGREQNREAAGIFRGFGSRRPMLVSRSDCAYSRLGLISPNN